MKLSSIRGRRGFTLIELTIAIMMGLATGGMVMALFNQQLAFLKVFQLQSFLTEEAPMVSVHVSRLIGKADRFRLHDSVSDAVNGINPRLSASPVLVLHFRRPDNPSGPPDRTVLSFETHDGQAGLYYYVIPANGTPAVPEWTVTKAPTDVTFAMVSGVLRMTLTGPQGEEITYSGTMQQ